MKKVKKGTGKARNLLAAASAPDGETSRARLVVVGSLCEHLSDGRHADEWYGVGDNPSHQTIWRWRKADEAIDEAIEEARRAGAHVLIDQAVAIADGTHPAAKGPESYPGQRKTQCWARFEAAKRIHPQRYGDKVALGGDASAPAIKVDQQGPAPVPTVDLAAQMLRAAEIAGEVIRKANGEDAEG